MRASRLVQLLLLLQTNGKMTASRLATELEVSVRTPYRDIEALRGAVLPINTAAGAVGGVPTGGGDPHVSTCPAPEEGGMRQLPGVRHYGHAAGVMNQNER